MLSINQALTLPMRLHAQVFEGRLLRADTTGLVLKLSRGQHGEILMLSSRQVRSIHPRFAEGTGSGRRPERCSYFEDCGKCAFGAGCRKTHDPRLLSQDAQCAVANGEDMAMRQQLTLHLATIPEGYDEARIRHEFAKYGKIQSVNICHKTSLLMGKGKEHWRFVCCPCVCSIALPVFAGLGRCALSPVLCTNVRNGFVTFSCEKQALHAKTSLNESGVSPKPLSPSLRCVFPRAATGPRFADCASITHSFQAFTGLVTFAKSTTLKANTSVELEKPSLPRPANYAVPVQGVNNTVFLGAKSPGSTMLVPDHIQVQPSSVCLSRLPLSFRILFTLG